MKFVVVGTVSSAKGIRSLVIPGHHKRAVVARDIRSRP
jgi:hypothetical protein